MLELVDVLGGIAWDNEIRGALTVVLGCTVLMGSVWLILATNTGVRLGTLLTFAGFFGWMFIMATIWTVYGTGYVGSGPSWVGEEIVFDDAGPAEIATEKVVQVNNNDALPRAIELVRTYGDASLQAELDFVDEADITTVLAEANSALDAADPRHVDDAALADRIAVAIDDANRKSEQLSLTQLAALSPSVMDAATANGDINFYDWRLVDAAGAGEAQTSAGAVLVEQGVFGDTGDFIFVNTYQRGGKNARASNDVWDRFSNRVYKLATLRHPTNYTVVQVQAVVAKQTVPGTAAAFAEADSEQPIINVVMIRDLGNRRQPTMLIAIGSFLAFAACCLALHARDRRFVEAQETYAAGA